MSSSKHLGRISREYALYTLQKRGIPNIEDGLKPVQRNALWLLRNRVEKIKTVGLAGQLAVDGLYVHGEVSAADAIGLLAAPFKNNNPLITGIGTFGSRKSPGKDGIGAPRYTSVARSSAAELLLYRDLDLVPLEDNYDGSNKQPKHFLPIVPLLLLNGISGMATGWSTEILPHDIKDIIGAVEDALKGKKIRDLTPHFAPYSVTVHPRDGLNKWEIRGKAEIVDTSTVRVTELPVGLSVEEFAEQLITMEDRGDIADFKNRCAKQINFEIRFPRGSIRGWTPDKAIEFLKLYERVTERIVVIDWGGTTPAVYDSPQDVVRSFAQWRLGWYTKRYEKMIRDHSIELVYWELLALLFKTKFTEKVRTFANRTEMADHVANVAVDHSLVVTEDTITRVLNLPIYRWTKDFAAEVEKKIANLKTEIQEFEVTLCDPKKLKEVYLNELAEVRRKTS